ncbi:tellurium resistance protein TerD [Filimonas lacunae]|uniref:Tellurium resistance protein TerD n=1 Tax=Filimonas lacunae TaxID=477680 RepID=A0A173MEC8_9BACT|nr:TerD family protein [Filimonas lacunae]BAV05952.1 tellurium resistance protein TerD [Filimonas lacunae]SIT23891.1 tellurium resistance protein TerD [Filimonas lacunae]
MAINLKKGQNIDVGLTNITIGLGWDPNEDNNDDNNFDLDLSAFMLNSSELIPTESFFVFFNNMDSPDGALHHTGDDLSGRNSLDGDDESIQIDLSKVSPQIIQIIFVATIHDYAARKQNFGQVSNSYIQIMDDNTQQVVAKYELGQDFSIETAVEFGKLYKQNGKWKFEASGVGHKQDLAFFLSRHYKGQIIK